MKRIIKYHSIYKSDGPNFSTCSTKYEIFPGLHSDESGIEVLRIKAKELGLKIKGAAKIDKKSGSREIEITHALELRKKIKLERRFNNKQEFVSEYLGFAKLVSNSTLPALEKINQKTPNDALFNIVNGCNAYDLGIDEYGEAQNGETWLIMSGWNFYHMIPLLGYNLEKFLKKEKIDDTLFYDSVGRCSCCNVYDYDSDGYTYNHRDTSDGPIGLKCGCYTDYAAKNIDEWVNDPSKAVEKEVVETLEESGQLSFVERFVGGMTDSNRLHSYDGETVRIGEPKSILDDLTKKDPKGEYVFCHDESGQFQTYFSVYKFNKKPTKKLRVQK